MRQIVLEQPGHFIERQAPAPIPGPGEALVGIRRVGVCGSDLHGFAGHHPAYKLPRVIGHEMSCEVLETPANEFGICPGDRCAIDSFLTCGECVACRLGRGNCCENLRFMGIHIDGGMQPLLNVPLEKLHKSGKLSFDQLVLVEPLGVGYHAVERAVIQADEEVIVVGAGPIGLATTQFALAAGARVRVIEIQETRREVTARLGVPVLPVWDNRHSNVVIDATGSLGAMEASFDYVAPGGRLVFVGLVQGRIAFDDWAFHRREMTILSSRNSLNAFGRIIRMLEDGLIDSSPWITHRMALADVPRQFASLAGQSNLVKAVVEISDSDL